MPSTLSAYPAEYFGKKDARDDALFYVMPRLVVHIDDAAIATLTALYDELIPAEATVLDLMSSWRSHLPTDKKLSYVLGHGMNEQELEENSQLNGHFVQNLNSNQVLPLEDSLFDAVTCAVSIQYLQRPLEVFGEVHRVLKPGGVFIISFSNRCFPDKAIHAWMYSNDQDHIGLVNSYFQFSGPWSETSVRIRQSESAENSDPLYMFYARKPADE